MTASAHRTTTDGVPARRVGQVAAAVVGGIVWTMLPIVYRFEELIYSIDALDPVEIPMLAALAPPLLLLGVWGFHERYASSYSWWGRGGLWALALGLLGLWPFALLDVVSVGFVVGFAAYFAGIAGTVVVFLGTIGVAIDCRHTGIPSRWMGMWFPLGLPASALVNYWAAHLNDYVWMGGHYYAGLFGLAWIAFGYRLWRPRRTER